MSFGETDRLPRLHLFSAAAIALLAAVLYAPQPPESFQATQDPKDFPSKQPMCWLRDGYDRIFTSDIWGGYLIYRLYPKAKVFIDGRSDFYGAAFDLKYLDVLDAKYDWDQNLDKYGAQTILLPADYRAGERAERKSALARGLRRPNGDHFPPGRRSAFSTSFQLPQPGCWRKLRQTRRSRCIHGRSGLHESRPSKNQLRSGDRPAKASAT